MYLENISRYVSLGSCFNEDEKAYRKMCVITAIMTFIALIPLSSALKGVWSSIAFAVFLISIACAIAAFKVSYYGLTLREALWFDAIISGLWIIDFSYCELMLLSIWQEFTPLFLLVCLPVLLVPLLVGFRIYRKLKSKNYNPRNVKKAGPIAGAGFASGLLGRHFAKALSSNPNALLVVAIVSCSIVSAGMSLGLLSLQKLYFIKKYRL